MKSKSKENSREHFSSRLGFILISAGCAIGLGNVWKFPYVVGQYGGAAFIVIYLICLIFLCLPIMTLEFSIGRASQKSAALAYDKLEPNGTKWHLFKWVSILGQYLLLCFYTTVCGWMLNYTIKEAVGTFKDATADITSSVFQNMISNPTEIIFWMIISCLVGMIICWGGVQKGVEKITKVMMVVLLILMICLAIFAILQPGAEKGLQFYLMPRFDELFSTPQNFFEVFYQALSMSFFTLSIGMGTMIVFGSYINKDRALFGEAVTIGLLDLLIALLAGFIIFPSCFAYNINPGSGPSLIFETLPNVFSNMPGGIFIAIIFFICLSFAALSTVIAVFENIVAFWMDLKGWSRKKSILINFSILIIGSLPCCFGFNLWNGIQFPLENINTIMDFEDFLISNNILPLGGLLIVFFCTIKKGWGWKNALKEINTGKGIKFPKFIRWWITYVIPIAIIFIFITVWANALGFM